MIREIVVFECTICGAISKAVDMPDEHICPKAIESQTTAVQQLKAEIASYADRLFELSRGGGELMPVMGVVNKLRQLSAV